MKINITYDREQLKKTVKVDEKATVKDVLKALDINPVTVIVSRDETLLLEDEELNDNDKLVINSVISGG